MSRVAQAAEAQFSRLRMNVKVGQGRIGHGISLMSTEPPHVAHYDETIMTPNLVFTIEPRFITDDGIFNCEELVLVTEQGGEFLTSAPRELATSY
jgi:Xaa-Pro aminopeptidase